MSVSFVFRGVFGIVTDLTVGKPGSVLFRFTFPLLLSVVFQQFYNIVDSIIAGHYIGVNALAAVGASAPITMLFLAIANGMNIGCSVVISQYFGGKHMTHMKSAVSTAVIASAGLSLILTGIGLWLSPLLLRLIDTPEEIMADSEVYLNIYILGLLFLFVYNIANAVFTALGDSRTPLFFLIVSSLGNIGLDILLVTRFQMGVSGVAWATFIAQGFASVAAILFLLRRMRKIKSDKPRIFSLKMLGRVSRIAIPSILQQSFVSVGNVFVQGLVNSFGATVVAAFAAASKLNTFTITTLCALGNGLSSYTAQNIGARNIRRVKQGFTAGILLALVIAVPFFIAFFFFPDYTMRVFVSEDSTAVIVAGVRFLKIVSPFYFLIPVKLVVDGILRGAGSMASFMVSTFSDLLLRVGFAYILAPYFAETGIWYSWPIGWTVASILSFSFYAAGVWKKRIPKDEIQNA